MLLHHASALNCALNCAWLLMANWDLLGNAPQKNPETPYKTLWDNGRMSQAANQKRHRHVIFSSFRSSPPSSATHQVTTQ